MYPGFFETKDSSLYIFQLIMAGLYVSNQLFSELVVRIFLEILRSVTTFCLKKCGGAYSVASLK